jgi:hypothetical protein
MVDSRRGTWPLLALVLASLALASHAQDQVNDNMLFRVGEFGVHAPTSYHYLSSFG